MEKFIQVYHDVISQEKCQYFIDKFEAYPEMQEVQNNSSIYDIVMQELQNTKGATLTQINLMKSADTPFRSVFSNEPPRGWSSLRPSKSA